MKNRTLKIVLIAAVCAVVASLVLKLTGNGNTASIVGGITGGVIGAVVSSISGNISPKNDA